MVRFLGLTWALILHVNLPYQKDLIMAYRMHLFMNRVAHLATSLWALPIVFLCLSLQAESQVSGLGLMSAKDCHCRISAATLHTLTQSSVLPQHKIIISTSIRQPTRYQYVSGVASCRVWTWLEVTFIKGTFRGKRLLPARPFIPQLILRVGSDLFCYTRDWGQLPKPKELTQVFRNLNTPLGISKLGKVIRESFLSLGYSGTYFFPGIGYWVNNKILSQDVL